MKILNLYAGIGGNRKLWGDEHEITAVEYNPDIAAIYKDYFQNDKMIIGDAHQYLLENYYKYEFIWSSPPCPTHSKLRRLNNKRVYPDMSLYQEIIFLSTWYGGKYLIENVVPYYEPLIPGRKSGRHIFWSNFYIPVINKIKNNPIKYWTYKDYEKKYGYDLSNYKLNGFDKRKILRNCVEPQLGKNIIEQLKLSRITIQNELFKI